MDAVCAATELASRPESDAPSAKVAESATTTGTNGCANAGDRALENVIVMWARDGSTPVCLRMHGHSSLYVLAGLYDATWRPGQPAILSLWPVSADYAGDLPRVEAWQVFGPQPLGWPAPLEAAA